MRPVSCFFFIFSDFLNVSSQNSTGKFRGRLCFIQEKRLFAKKVSKKKLQPFQIFFRAWSVLISPYVNIERFRKKLWNYEQQLKAKREYSIKKKIELDEKWAKIAADGNMLKSNFIAFNNFMISNAEKRKRTNETIAELKQVMEVREKNMVILRSKIEFMKEAKQDLEREISTHFVFEVKYIVHFPQTKNNFRVLAILK